MIRYRKCPSGTLLRVVILPTSDRPSLSYWTTGHLTTGIKVLLYGDLVGQFSL